LYGLDVKIILLKLSTISWRVPKDIQLVN